MAGAAVYPPPSPKPNAESLPDDGLVRAIRADRGRTASGGYPIVPLVFIAASSAFVVNTLMERPRESLAGLAFLALGVPVYWWSRK